MSVARLVFAAFASVAGLLMALPIAALALPFQATAWLTHKLAARLQPKASGWQALIRFDPIIGWKPKANLRGYHTDLNGDVHWTTTDAEGWRGRHGTLQDCDVAVFGDSFAFGHAIEDGGFFAELGGDIRIKAVGAPGYNMVQELMLIEQMANLLVGKLVVWLIYPGNDLHENLQPEMEGYRTPFVGRDRGGDWEIVTRHVSPEPWPFPTRRPGYESFVRVCSPTLLSERAFSACEYLIARGRAACEAVGARLVVATIPDLSRLVRDQIACALVETKDASFDGDLPDRRIGEIAARLGVGFVALKDHLDARDYLEEDVHWNARGNRRVADLLRRMYADHVARRADGAGARAREAEGDLRTVIPAEERRVGPRAVSTAWAGRARPQAS